jgi:membrane protein YqaA with SNARE-associated domain
MHRAALLAFAGGSLAQLVNYGAGCMLLYLKRQGVLKLNDAIYYKGLRLCRTWLLPLLLFSWAPLFGALIAVAFAFFKVPAKWAFPLLLLGQTGYWVYIAL